MRIAVLVVIHLAFAVASPSLASACSKLPLWAPLGGSTAYFIGTAAADTVLAGPGDVAFDPAAGPERPIFGQLLRVEAIGGPASAVLPADGEEVVLVPWGYRADCVPTVLRGSYRWVEPESRGFYLGELRAREHWVGERPTFDVHDPSRLPYISRERPFASLSVEETFAFFEALPEAEAIDSAGMSALGSLQSWVDQNATLAEGWPASDLIYSVQFYADRNELSRLDHPVRGTWRFDIELPDGATHTVYGRTDRRWTSRWSPSRSRTLLPSPSDPFDFSAPEGLTLLVRIYEDDPTGPVTSATRETAYLHTILDAGGATAGDLTWPGWISSSFLQVVFEGDPVVQQVVADERERYRILSEAGLPAETPASFTRGADGVLRVQQSYQLGDGRTMIVRGEQLAAADGSSPG